MQALCPPFVRFGAHPYRPCAECRGVKGDRAGICRTCNGTGSGSDFGFWPDWDAIEEIMPLDRNVGEGDDGLPMDNCIINVNDRGKITVMDLDRNVLWSAAS